MLNQRNRKIINIHKYVCRVSIILYAIRKIKNNNIGDKIII